MKLKLRSSVSVINRGEGIIEFFKTNTREQIIIRSNNDLIEKFLPALDGSFTLEEYIKANELKAYSNDLNSFVQFLHSKGILSNTVTTDLILYNQYRRNIHFIEDYSVSKEHLEDMWSNILNSTVVIIGLGAVGTWVALNLIQSGVRNLILIDKDIVESTNLHRQVGFKESDIGKLKTDALQKSILKMNPKANIVTFNKFLNKTLLDDILEPYSVDLIINCADSPNVDTTSLWVGEYGLKYNIPHIIGGGYNMHLSLIGQTIIPYKSACVKCFETQLKEINNIDPNSVKKLTVKNRKLGSFGPMCSIISSFIGIEAIKILTKSITPANINRRGEFDIYKMDILYTEYRKLKDCEWCGGKEL